MIGFYRYRALVILLVPLIATVTLLATVTPLGPVTLLVTIPKLNKLQVIHISILNNIAMVIPLPEGFHQAILSEINLVLGILFITATIIPNLLLHHQCHKLMH